MGGARASGMNTHERVEASTQVWHRMPQQIVAAKASMPQNAATDRRAGHQWPEHGRALECWRQPDTKHAARYHTCFASGSNCFGAHVACGDGRTWMQHRRRGRGLSRNVCAVRECGGVRWGESGASVQTCLVTGGENGANTAGDVGPRIAPHKARTPGQDFWQMRCASSA